MAKKAMTQIVEPVVLRNLSDQENQLIRQAFCAVLEPTGRGSELVTRELDRVGFSGARIFSVARDDVGLPLIVKIGPKEKIEREYRAMRSVAPFFSEVRNVPAPCYSETQGAFAYQHHTLTASGRIRIELHHILSQRQVEGDKVAEAIRSVLSHLSPSLQATRIVNMSPGEAFGRYLEDLSHAAEVVYACLGLRPSDATVGFESGTLSNPIQIAETARGWSLPIAQGPIHGDLHPRNIIVDGDGTHCSLIDFEFATPSGPMLVDFALLELSLRHFQFPLHANPKCELLVHQALAETLQFEPAEIVQMCRASYGRELELEDAYERVLPAVAVLRDMMSEALAERYGGEDQLHRSYLVTQLVLALSSVVFTGVNQHNLALNSAVLATRIEETMR